MPPTFEGVANMDDWPPNEAGKPTQAAVIGAYHATRGKVFELLWTGKFPDLQPAMYWAAKKEVEAVRKGKWLMASRILWQHDLTPEQALASSRAQMEPQIDAAIKQMEKGTDAQDFDFGPGPMQPVDHSKAQGYYVEVTKPDDPHGDPLAAFFGGPPSDDVPMQWDLPGGEDEAGPKPWIPDDPRRE